MNRTRTDSRPPSPEVVAIASQQGGVGKSTTALNLAIALVAAGRTVLLMDLDPHGQTGLTLMSGVQPGGTERMLREASLTREMMTATEIPDLFLVPAGPGLSGLESELGLLGDSRTRLHQALATLPALPFHFDFIVIDCPPSVGLLTLNALAAAHRILLPVPCEPGVIEGLPTLLKTIGRLRAGLQQPLLGVHLLLVRRTPSASAQALAKTLRQEYEPLMLLTEIPLDDAVRDAGERGLPLLAHCLPCDASQAYLELAAEWRWRHEERQQPEHRWSFRTRRARMSRDRDKMSKRIQAWLMDPSSLLYDETWEARRQQTAPAFDELFRTQPPKRRARVLTPLLLLLALSVALLLHFRLPEAPWRMGLNGLLPGAEHLLPTHVLSSMETSIPARPEPVDAPDKPETVDTSDKPELAYTPDAWESLFMGDDTEDAAMTNIVETLAPDAPEQAAGPVEIQIPPLPDYRWYAQVLAGRSLDRVREDSQVFMRKHAVMLDRLRLVISQSRFGDARDAFYRLRVIGWDSQRAAADWCKRLRNRGQGCLVIRVDEDAG
ncbi:hypothetical protein CCR95_20370 [Thiocystis minor]|uniref:ParA family protein n=1 Tax=Thiocystis minor TaxID=61597 RepID=UPI001914B8C0|nr:AAA family ATPase [Thiocystis minor]MBK5966373.1 hypothetical protein [Thiocystis minor]